MGDDVPSIDLTDQVAVITGAARGIGRATARLFATQGARLALVDRHGDELDAVAAELTDRGCEVLAATADVRDGGATTAFMEAAIGRFGRVDVLVNNAGGSFVAPFLDTSEKGEAMLIAENFTQVTRLVRLAVPAMGAGSAIINVTSIEAFQGAPGFATYSAMKAALENLTCSLALELAPRGIRVNSIAPDALPSEGEQGARGELLDSGLDYDPAFLPPLGFFGTPGDGAAAALFLASSMSRFITGTTVHVDGGNFAAGGWRRRTDAQGAPVPTRHPS